MQYCDVMCGDVKPTVENDVKIKQKAFMFMLVGYLWLPSVTVGTMVMFPSGLKGRKEPYHVLTNVSLWKPAHSTQQQDEAFLQLATDSKKKTELRKM